jgi:deoxyribodipyrimidine photolyase-related protein
MGNTLRLILGDQLNAQHSWFSTVDNHITYVMIESREEGSYAPHHIQKVTGIFSAMRQFAQSLQSSGHHFYYHSILDGSEPNLRTILAELAQKKGIKHIELQEPDEWRLREDLEKLQDEGFEISWYSSEHFISSSDEFQRLFKGKKTFLMETFYRALRKKNRSPNGWKTARRWEMELRRSKPKETSKRPSSSSSILT